MNAHTARPGQTAPPHPRVVVGVADSAEGRAALRFAAELAESFSLPLHLVRVWRDVDWFLSAPAGAPVVPGGDRAGDQRLLDHAAARARQLAPGIPVTAEIVAGSIYAVLLERSPGAYVLVLGAAAGDDPGDIGGWYLEHAHCPVIVVDAAGRILDDAPARAPRGAALPAPG